MTNHKKWRFYELPNIEFRITLLKDFNKLQVNPARLLNKIRKRIHGQNERFNKERELNRILHSKSKGVAE